VKASVLAAKTHYSGFNCEYRQCPHTELAMEVQSTMYLFPLF